MHYDILYMYMMELMPFFVILVVKNGSISVYKRMKYIKLYIAGKLRTCTF